MDNNCCLLGFKMGIEWIWDNKIGQPWIIIVNKFQGEIALQWDLSNKTVDLEWFSGIWALTTLFHKI